MSAYNILLIVVIVALGAPGVHLKHKLTLPVRRKITTRKQYQHVHIDVDGIGTKTTS